MGEGGGTHVFAAPGFGAEVAEEREVAESAVILTFIGRFVAVGEGLGIAFVLAEGTEGEGGAKGGGGGGVGGVLGGDFAVEIDGLEGDDATLTPGGDGHAVDDVEFGFGGGAVGGDVGIEEGEEAGFGFTLDDDGFGEHAVGDLGASCLGAFLMAFLCGWALGEGSVGASGGEFAGGGFGRLLDGFCGFLF